MHSIPPQHDDSRMQNQTPTANLQALVPKFAARGQWFRKYFLTPASNSQLKQNSNSKYIRNAWSTLKEDLNI